MSEQITSAAEFDALPEYSVIRIYDGQDPNAAICYDLPEGRRWFTTVDAPSADGNGYSSSRLAEYYIDDQEWGQPLVLRPDEHPAGAAEPGGRGASVARGGEWRRFVGSMLRPHP